MNRVHRIGRGSPSGEVAVSFDPADQRRCRNLLAWFERGAEPGATLLVDDWRLCAGSDPGLAQSIRWITSTHDTEVVITAGAPNDVPEHLRSFVRLGFLALHGLSGFTKATAWKGDWSSVPVGAGPRGDRAVVELTHLADGRWRTGSHLHTTTPETFRSLVLGLMTTHSPKLFQAVLVDAHDSAAFAGLASAPHVRAHHRGVATDPALAEQISEMLLAESQRRLDVVGITWTVFDHRGFDQVLPQLLVCVTGLEEILAAHPGFAATLAGVAEDAGKSGMQLLLDAPHDLAPHRVPDCTVPADLDDVAAALPELMRRPEPVPGFLALHGVPDGFDRQRTWRLRPVREQFRVAAGTDEHGQPVGIDIKSSSLQDGMGPHGEVLGPAGRRAELHRAVLLGQMLWHSPDDLQLVLVDFHGTGAFPGLDNAPHVHGSYRGMSPAIAGRVAEALRGEHERRTGILAAGHHRTTWDYREARSRGAPLDPLPELLVCVDGVRGLLEAHPEFVDVLTTFGREGRTYGQHLLLSDTAPAGELREFVRYGFELTAGGWVRRIGRSVENLALPPDLGEVARSLPRAMQKVEPLHDQLLPPPLHEWPSLTLDELGSISPEHRAVPLGMRDVPFEHRVEVFFAAFGEGGHGAIVGKPGSGRTTALRTLTESITRTFGSTTGFHLADGPLYGRPDARHVVVTASTWAEVPEFIRDDLAWGVELKLADPSWSIVDARRQAHLPDRPGTGLCTYFKQQVRIATS
ncbi:FtsK/SpoIIIE family protein [Lentzea xinjiangensis]|uniref:FtsK/SpoIIIE family protein n=1 Tax=Lentzea xinjiangensis TaxID=402600 RepID=A0A1H9AQ26_9PSEU|nr:FtsK/SpoIIIE domain-containing protein [Lentzea xinjiangensis]SEP78018.1 FtsK/SpoIIIE family protein [Lentzea xinjiangensis]